MYRHACTHIFTSLFISIFTRHLFLYYLSAYPSSMFQSLSTVVYIGSSSFNPSPQFTWGSPWPFPSSGTPGSLQLSVPPCARLPTPPGRASWSVHPPKWLPASCRGLDDESKEANQYVLKTRKEMKGREGKGKEESWVPFWFAFF